MYTPGRRELSTFEQEALYKYGKKAAPSEPRKKLAARSRFRKRAARRR